MAMPDAILQLEIRERDKLIADNKRLRKALKDTKHFFLGHFDDSCAECRRGLATIEAALK